MVRSYLACVCVVHVDGGIHQDGCFLWACVSDNNIGEEGANALAPHMGKLVNMNTLHLNSKRVLVMRVWCKLLVVFMVMGGVCVREQHW